MFVRIFGGRVVLGDMEGFRCLISHPDPWLGSLEGYFLVAEQYKAKW